MRRNLSFIIFCNLILLAATFISSSAAKEDFAGSSDHPLIGRYEGSWIGGYKFSEFDEYNVVTGKITTKGENVLAIEGKVTTIAYHIPNDVSVLQFYRNYKSKILDTGFNVIFECKSSEECGRNFSNTFDIMPIPKMWGGSDYHFLASKMNRPEGEVYATLYCESLGGSGKTGCQVSIVEIEALKYKMVDADEMAQSIGERGSVALYGIYFNFDKALIKPESKPTMDEIAKLMKNNAGLHLVVVGHTDNKGSLKYNMDLSKRRAQAVANALINDYGIQRKRIEHWGVGYLAPVASNRTEEGRAKNRRVELVE